MRASLTLLPLLLSLPACEGPKGDAGPSIDKAELITALRTDPEFLSQLQDLLKDEDSLRGFNGRPGEKGIQGEPGEPGMDGEPGGIGSAGMNGADGKDASLWKVCGVTPGLRDAGHADLGCEASFDQCHHARMCTLEEVLRGSMTTIRTPDEGTSQTAYLRSVAADDLAQAWVHSGHYDTSCENFTIRARGFTGTAFPLVPGDLDTYAVVGHSVTCDVEMPVICCDADGRE